MYGKSTVDGLCEDKCWKQRHDMDNAIGVYRGNNTPYSNFSPCEVKYVKKMLVFDIYMAVLLRIQAF